MNPIPHRGTFPGDNFKEHPEFTPREGVARGAWGRFPFKSHRSMHVVMLDEQRAALVDAEAEQRLRAWKQKQDRDRYERERRGQRV